MKKYILDTSAILTLIENEDGVKDVENLLLEAIDQKVRILISVVSVIELYYISLREQSKGIADERMKLIQDLPISQHPIDSGMSQIIGQIKATKSMSFADCCIAGLAKVEKAVVVHKDPEFEQIEDEIKVYKLPYRKK